MEILNLSLVVGLLMIGGLRVVSRAAKPAEKHPDGHQSA